MLNPVILTNPIIPPSSPAQSPTTTPTAARNRDPALLALIKHRHQRDKLILHHERESPHRLNYLIERTSRHKRLEYLLSEIDLRSRLLIHPLPSHQSILRTLL